MSEEKIFMRVDEVAETLGISKSHAYKIVHQLNKEMAQMGYITVSGRVNRKYFMRGTWQLGGAFDRDPV